MTYLIAFLMAVGHDPSKSGSGRKTLWEPAFILGFVGLAALFVWEVVSG
jgi:multisubunit Na+/H+ antiporter MnhB subunit